MTKKHSTLAAAASLFIFLNASFVLCESPDEEKELYQKGKDIVSVTENIDEKQYPNLAKLKKLFLMEGTIDFSAANLERRNMVDTLTYTLKKEDLDRLVALSEQVALSVGRRDRIQKETDLYKFMFKYASEIDYPKMYYLIGYNELFLEIDPDKLKEEIESFSY